MLYEIDAGDPIDFARCWAGLGDAVSEQVSQVVDAPRAAAGLRSTDLEVNPNAIELAKERVGGLNEQIDTGIEEYFELLAEARQ